MLQSIPKGFGTRKLNSSGSSWEDLKVVSLHNDLQVTAGIALRAPKHLKARTAARWGRGAEGEGPGKGSKTEPTEGTPADGPRQPAPCRTAWGIKPPYQCSDQ